MRNIELTMDQNYRLEQSKFYYGYDDYQNLVLKNYLEDNLTDLEWEDLTFLYKFNIEELMNILLGNYKVKKTTEEIILERFNINDYIKNEFSEGVRFGIRFTLNAYGNKIKGVND